MPLVRLPEPRLMFHYIRHLLKAKQDGHGVQLRPISEGSLGWRPSDDTGHIHDRSVLAANSPVPATEGAGRSARSIVLLGRKLRWYLGDVVPTFRTKLQASIEL